MSDNKKDFELQGKKPKAMELNKKLIILIGGALAIIVLLMVVFSAGSSNKSGSGNTNSPEATAPQAGDVNKIADISYADRAQIDKMLGTNQPTKVVEKLPPDLQRQLDALKQQQAQSQAELARLRAQKQAPPPKPIPQLSPLDREAANTSIFFPGGAPRPLQDSMQKEQEKQQAKGSDDKSPQAQKERFMQGEVNKDVTNQNTIQNPISKYTIFAGSVIPAILQTKLVSNLPGTIVARVNQNVYDTVTGQYLLIPKGSTLIGLYNSSVTYGQYQLQAKFVRLIRPDGSSIILPNQAGVDDMGVSGLEDEIDNHWMQLIGAAALTTVFNVPAVVAQNSQYQNGITYNQDTGTPQVNYGPTVTNSALQSMGQSVSQIGNKIVSRSMEIQPTIIINAGKLFAVMVTKDLVLPPYNTSEDDIN